MPCQFCTAVSLFLLALLLSAAPPAFAAPSSIDLQATLGFSNTFRPDRWTPLTVTVSNHGHDISGYLEVRTRDGDDFRNDLFDTTHRRRIDLTRDSRKRMHFTVLLSNVANPLLIRVLAHGKELAVRRIDLRTHFTADRLLIVVSRDANLDYLNDTGGAGTRVLYPHPELLPDHWQGYDAVSAVVLHGVSLEQLSTRQYAALRKWVAQGGTLALSGGADYAWLRTPRMAELLPAMPVGMVEITNPASVRNVFGRPLEITRPFHVNQLPASNARVAVHAGGVPLVVESRLGRGRVVYLTFDIARAPFDRWPGMQQTWFELLHITATPALDPLVEAAPSPVQELVALRGAEFPGHGTLLLFLALYLSVLLTGYHFAASPAAKRWLLALATWAAPLLFAPAAYFLFGAVLFDRGASAAIVSVIEPLGDSGYAHVQFDLAIHSNRDGNGDSDGALLFSYAGAEPTLRAPGIPRQSARSANRTAALASWTFSEDLPRAVAPDDARRYAMHLLEGEDIIDFDLHATIDLGGNDAGANSAPRVKIHNNSGRALSDAWLIAGDRVWSVGAIAAQGVTTYHVQTEGFDLNSRSDEWWDRLERHPAANANSVFMVQTLVARKDSTFVDENGDRSTYPGRGKALLIARTTQALLPTGTSATWQHTQRTLLLLTMPAGLLVKDESTVIDL